MAVNPMQPPPQQQYYLGGKPVTQGYINGKQVQLGGAAQPPPPSPLAQATQKKDSEFDVAPVDLNSFSTSPYVSQLAQAIKNPINVGTAYQAKDMTNTALPQYDAMRARLNQQFSQSQNQAQDSIDRQFAAMGGGPGNGAQIKQTENLAAETNKQKDLANQDINAQEAQARFNLGQTESQRAYESGEALKGRTAQAGEFGVEQLGNLGQLDLAFKNAQQQANNDAFNRALAEYQAKHSGGLFGGGGFLGLGL